MDIRIGNDIKMNLTLKGPNDFDKNNIKEVRCYLINTTLEDGCCCDGGCPIERRFPREPFPQYYMPTPYTLHGCGKPIIGGLGTMDLDQILANFRIVANTDRIQ